MSLPCLIESAPFDPAALVGVDVGNPSIPGSTTAHAGFVEMTSVGAIGFKSDQFHFASSEQPGDFDVRVRVASLKNTDLWAKAGLMLRADKNAGDRFAGVFATPSGAGCLFQARLADQGAAASQGFFPANQPFTWLRLRRTGDTIAGYAGYDGSHWTPLGNQVLALGTHAFLGLVVCSHSTNATSAEFRDLGAAVDPKIEQVPVTIEPLGPSSRRTALVISEIMYHPADSPDGKNLEFIELYNSQPYFEDISGWKLDGDVEFTFPPGTLIPGGAFLVVAGAPEDLRLAYALDNVLGPFSGKLANAGGNLRLEGAHNAVYLEVDYKDKAPWPELADGAGHSLVLVRPSYGEADPFAWSASRIKGGSPGMPEAVEIASTSGVRINECQLPDADGAGFVELFNGGTLEADLGGLRMGRSADATPFSVSDGTKLPPGGFIHFTYAQLDFALKAAGDTLYLESADRSRFIDASTFGPQAPGTSAGRWPNGAPVVLALPEPTPGAANIHPRTDILINEIHHSPLSGDNGEEFVELFNAGKSPADLSFWEFRSGVSYTFPQGTSIPSGGYLVVAHDAARLRQVYTNLDAAVVLGDFTGKLKGSGEHLTLSRPITIKTATGTNDTVLASVCEAAYSGGGRWSQWADRGGSTLELADSRANASLSSSWADSDESARGEWTTVEFTGVLDNGPTGGGFGGWPGGPGGGTITPDSLHIILLGEGECLIDNVEVVGPGNNNRIANGTFENGVTGWTFSGNHSRTSLETTEGCQSGQSLHLRASGNGDTGANKIAVKLSQALATGNTATLRARVKWLRGWPEILLRLHGNFLEAYGRLGISAAPGTPGAKNTRAVDNAGPAFGKVAHFPAVPAVDEPVVVTALIDDPDGVATVTLRYRVDPSTSLISVMMTDDGTGGDAVPGDGIFSAIIPASGSAKLVAFTIEAKDRASKPASSVFPPGAAGRECLVRFGDGSQSGAFGTYRLWVTQTNSTAWKNRAVLSNEPIESTFVYGQTRVVYNVGGRFAGSPFHQQFTDGPASAAHFVIELPKDDRVLGASAFNKLHAPGNGAFDDTTLQREQAVYWLARKSGLPWLHRRYFHFYVNGVKKQTLMEDTQVGNDDLVNEFWPEDTGGSLYKMQPWFEFPDSSSLTAQNMQMQSSSFVSFSRYTTTGNQLKLARYRWNWLVRGAEGTANDYTNVLQFINLATDTTNTAYEANIEKVVDVDQWFRAFAINHAVGNWDSIGYRNAQNTYSYKPRNARWELVIWDANIAFGNSNSDGPSNLPLFTATDPIMTRWFSQGGFKRRFLTAYYELVNGPMQSSLIAPMLDAKYAAFQEHGIAATSPEAIKTWLTSARNYILSQLAKDSGTFAISSVGGTNSLTLVGTGPLGMVSLEINGDPVALKWTGTKTWSAQYAPDTSSQELVVTALDSSDQPVSGAQIEIPLAAPGSLILLKKETEFIFIYPVYRSGAYKLESTASLQNPVWQTLATQTANVGAMQFKISTPTLSAAFYRVVEP